MTHVGKLRKTDRYTAANRHAAIKHRLFRQEQALATIGADPRQQLSAEQADDGAGTARAVEAKGVGVAKAEGFNAGFHRESDWFEE